MTLQLLSSYGPLEFLEIVDGKAADLDWIVASPAEVPFSIGISLWSSSRCGSH